MIANVLQTINNQQTNYAEFESAEIQDAHLLFDSFFKNSLVSETVTTPHKPQVNCTYTINNNLSYSPINVIKSPSKSNSIVYTEKVTKMPPSSEPKISKGW